MNRRIAWGVALAAVAGTAAILAGCSTTATTRFMTPSITPTPTPSPTPSATGVPNLSTSTKSVSPLGTVLPGAVLHYYLNIVNSGASAATGVVVTDNLPAGLNLATLTFVAGPAGTLSGSTVTWTLGTVPVGSLTIHFTVQVAASASPGLLSNSATLTLAGVAGSLTLGPASVTVGSLSNTATPSATSTFTSTETSTPTFSATGLPNFSSSTKNAVPSGTVLPGQTLHYYINLVNNGGSTATGVVVTDTLPGALDPTTVVYLSGPSGSVSGWTITWNVGVLPVGTMTLHFTVQVLATAGAGTNLTNTASITASNVIGTTTAGPATNTVGALSPTASFTFTTTFSATATTTATPSWTPVFTGTTTSTATQSGTFTGTSTQSPTATGTASLNGSGKTGPVAGVMQNGIAHFYIAVSSSGGSAATGVTVTDALDPNLDPATVVFWSTPAGTIGGSTITWNLGTLAAGSTTTIHFSVAVRGSAPVGTSVCNTATLAAANAATLGVGSGCFSVVPASPTLTLTNTPTGTNTFPAGFTPSVTSTATQTTPTTSTNTPVPPSNTFTNTPTPLHIYVVGGGNQPLGTPTAYADVLYAAIPWNGGNLAWSTNPYVVNQPIPTPTAYSGGVYEGWAGFLGNNMLLGWGIDGLDLIELTNVGAFTAGQPPVGPFAWNTPEPEFSQFSGYGQDANAVYVLGGVVYPPALTPTAQSPDVWIVTNPGGSVLMTAGTPLPVGKSQHGVAFDSTFLYVCGGVDTGNVVSSACYMAPTNGGNPGPWSTLPSLPTATRRLSGSATWANGYLYVVGGFTAASAPASTVYGLQVTNGSVTGTWFSAGTLPVARAYMTAFAAGGYLYAVGGTDFSGANFTSYPDVFYAPIFASGSLGSFTTGTALPRVGGLAPMRVLK